MSARSSSSRSTVPRRSWPRAGASALGGGGRGRGVVLVGIEGPAALLAARRRVALHRGRSLPGEQPPAPVVGRLERPQDGVGGGVRDARHVVELVGEDLCQVAL